MAGIQDITPESHGDKTGEDVAKAIAPLMGVNPEDISEAVIVAYLPEKGGIAFGGAGTEMEIAQFLHAALDVLTDAIAEDLARSLFADAVVSQAFPQREHPEAN